MHKKARTRKGQGKDEGFVEIGILHRRRTGDVDFLQSADVIPLGLHETLTIFMRAPSKHRNLD